MSEDKRAGAWEIREDYPVPAARARVNRNDGATILFLGDLHLDHPRSDRKAVKRLLDEAVARDAAVILLGDQFDVMQGVADRRSAKSDLARRYAGRDDYLTAVLEDVSTFLVPYAPWIWVVLDGNHESAITKYNEISLTRLLVHELRRAGGNAVTPGYQSYALLQLTWSNDNRCDETVPLWLAHGHGGGGEVTKGSIQAHRRAVTYPDAHIVVSGHIHSSYYIAHEQHRITSRGLTYDIEQEHYVVNTAKDEFSKKSGYHVEKGRGPRLLSGWWGSFYRARGEELAGMPMTARWDFWRAKP
jgi:UDP-2,3-diacylglucosamine pyrophosphatase LpxH